MRTPKSTNRYSGQHDQHTALPSGKRRRIFIRHPITLDATLIASEGRIIPCVIRDFCPGGLLLNFKPHTLNHKVRSFNLNEPFTIKCIVPIPSNDKSLELQTRIAHIVKNGLGLAFINPQRDAIDIMQQFALHYSSINETNRISTPGTTSVVHGPACLFDGDISSVISSCEVAVQTTLNALLEELKRKLPLHLFRLSRETNNPQLQKAYFSAFEILNKNNDKFIEAVRSEFQERLQIRLNSLASFGELSNKRAADFSIENMSLIEDEDLGAWIAVSDITSKVEDKCRETLTALNQQLSILLNTNISHTNNPYSPALFAESFQIGLARFNLGSAVNNECHALLKEVLLAVSAELYDKLKNILIEYEIIPNTKYRIIHQSTAVRKNNSHARSPHPPYEAATSSPALITPYNLPPDPHKSRSVVDGEKTSADHTVTTLPSSVPVPTAAKATKPTADLYEVVNNLYLLRHNINQSIRNIVPIPADPLHTSVKITEATMDNQKAGEYYDTAELVAAISNMQDTPKNFPPISNESMCSKVKERVLAALASRTPGSVEKYLEPYQSNVLEVTGGLLDAMQSDPLITDIVKPLLKKLELPVLKLALQDHAMILDQSHVVRRVLNKMAQLELYHYNSIIGVQSSVKEAIEGLLEELGKDSTDAIPIFSELLIKLSTLKTVQDKAYSSNIQDVIRECLKHPPTANILNLEEYKQNLSPEEIRKWDQHTRRLKEGNDVLLCHPDGRTQHLRIAWIAAMQSLYVFVNLQGLREIALYIEDLAIMLRIGMLKPINNAGDPAMDRAQNVILKELYQEVLHDSTHDNLTGLINRREFERRLSQIITHVSNDSINCILLFIDIDMFSTINDLCGYAGGDQLLCDLAELIKDNLKQEGVIARLGSDEFGVFLHHCCINDALAVSERLIDAVKKYKLEFNGNHYATTLSIGLVQIDADHSDTNELLQAAEKSCKSAKEMGGNRIQVFRSNHARNTRHDGVAKWLGKIDDILENECLELRCQQIAPIGENGSLLPHFEILACLKGEQSDVEVLHEFMVAAEWYHRMPDVDRYVIKKVFSWMRDNKDAMQKFSGFTVNLSGQSINEERFVDFILDQLESTSVPRDKVCFEVTETVGITNLSDAAVFIDRIKMAGCRFALDDFGSGMSSYGYLRDLPVDLVKIDGAFVKDMTLGSCDYAVVKSITEIVHFMNKKIVAECVENHETLDLLRDIGVDYAQGYLIDKPDSLDRILDMEFPTNIASSGKGVQQMDLT